MELDGQKDRLTYQITEFPEEDYSVAIQVCLIRLPEGHLGQVFSAWAAPMDDPLRFYPKALGEAEINALIQRTQIGKNE